MFPAEKNLSKPQNDFRLWPFTARLFHIMSPWAIINAKWVTPKLNYRTASIIQEIHVENSLNPQLPGSPDCCGHFEWYLIHPQLVHPLTGWGTSRGVLSSAPRYELSHTLLYFPQTFGPNQLVWPETKHSIWQRETVAPSPQRACVCMCPFVRLSLRLGMCASSSRDMRAQWGDKSQIFASIQTPGRVPIRLAWLRAWERLWLRDAGAWSHWRGGRGRDGEEGPKHG